LGTTALRMIEKCERLLRHTQHTLRSKHGQEPPSNP
jgi:hypothetical protein